MRILYLSYSTIPSHKPDSVHVMKMSEAYAELGHEVVLVSIFNPKLSVFSQKTSFEYYGVEPLFKIIEVPHGRIKGKNFFQCLAFFKVINKFNPDLIHCRHMFGAWLGTLLGKNVVYEIHVDLADEGTLVNWVTKRVLNSKHCLAVITISQALSARLANHVKNKRVIVAPDAYAELKQDNEASTTPTKRGSVSIGYAGSLKMGRGIDLIIELAKRRPEINFNVAGGTPREVSYWREQGIPQNLFFHGHLEHREVSGFLRSQTILLMPYQPVLAIGDGPRINTSPYMSPMKLFEYMGAGKPFICSDLPSIREIVSNDEHCLMVEPDKTEQWLGAIDRLISSKKIAAGLAKQARALVLNKYSWKSRVENILNQLAKIGIE